MEPLHQISREVRLKTDPDDAWSLVGDFGGIHRWHPGTSEPVIRPSTRDGIPTIERVFGKGTPEELVEQLVERDDKARTISYSMPHPPFEISDHLATMTVSETEDGTVVTWTAQFRAADDVAESLEAVLGDGVFRSGLDGLAEALDTSPGRGRR